MKIKFNLITALILFLNLNCIAQTKYYNINGGVTTNEEGYNDVKKKLKKNGKVEEFHLKTIVKNDSVINYINLGNLITTPDGFDPWRETKKNIGNKFQIDKFEDSDSKNFKKDYFNGKPTVINFWFTRCPPCISEIPTLNNLKEKFGDNVNFISITFENQNSVDEFLKKHEFNFTHIPNSKNQIEELKISGYPTTFILDKNGIIKIVTPEINEYNREEIETILNILQ
jgi:thiol-disulfide isomerase/thioredoxin